MAARQPKGAEELVAASPLNKLSMKEAYVCKATDEQQPLYVGNA